MTAYMDWLNPPMYFYSDINHNSFQLNIEMSCSIFKTLVCS